MGEDGKIEGLRVVLEEPYAVLLESMMVPRTLAPCIL